MSDKPNYQMKIDKKGYLHLDRNGEMMKQLCPRKIDVPCGDHCPKFKIMTNSNSMICIDCCGTEHICPKEFFTYE